MDESLLVIPAPVVDVVGVVDVLAILVDIELPVATTPDPDPVPAAVLLLLVVNAELEIAPVDETSGLMVELED